MGGPLEPLLDVGGLTKKSMKLTILYSLVDLGVSFYRYNCFLSPAELLFPILNLNCTKTQQSEYYYIFFA